MSGEFNKQFYHGVPALNTWETLCLSPNIVRKLTTDESNAAREVQNNLQMDTRYNVTIRWHERHHAHCPYRHGTAAEVPVAKAPAGSTQLDLDHAEIPCKHASARQPAAPDMKGVTRIVPPVPRKVPTPPPPPKDSGQKHHVPQASSSSAAWAEPSQKPVDTPSVDTEKKAVETQGVDTDMKTVETPSGRH